MTVPARPALHHIAVTVTDLEASTRWYEDVFAINAKTEVPHQGAVADNRSTQSPIADEAYGSVLVFLDLDNIQLELSCPKA